MSSLDPVAHSDTDSELSNDTEVSTAGVMGLNQADIDAAMILLDIRARPQLEIECERWTSNLPAAMQAAQPCGVQIEVMNWGSTASKAQVDVKAQAREVVVNKRSTPSRACASHRGTVLKLDIPKRLVVKGHASNRIARRTAVPKMIRPKQTMPASSMTMDSSASTVRQATSTHGQQRQRGDAAPVICHPGAKEEVSSVDGTAPAPIPTEKNLHIALHSCGHVSIVFNAIENGLILESRDVPCSRLVCQAAYPQSSFARTGEQISLRAQDQEIKQCRAELCALNAVINQAAFRLEFAITGSLEPSLWTLNTRDRVVVLETKLPVIAVLLRNARHHANLWYVHAYLQAAKTLLEQAQTPFKRFCNWVDDMCEEVELHQSAGRFTEAEIDRLGAILPVGNGKTNTAER